MIVAKRIERVEVVPPQSSRRDGPIEGAAEILRDSDELESPRWRPGAFRQRRRDDRRRECSRSDVARTRTGAVGHAPGDPAQGARQAMQDDSRR